jgi:hypothetical protein
MANISGQEHRPGVGQSAQELKSKAQETASSVADKARETAATVGDRAREMASGVGHRVSEAASSVGHKADEAASSVGSGMQSLAGTLRQKLPHEGMVGSAGSAVADTLERGGRYLQDEGLSGMAHDLTNLVRRNPIPSLLIAFGVGFVIARSTMRS